MATITLDQVATLAAQLTPAEQLKLVERIARELAASPSGEVPPVRRSWQEIRGMMPYPMCGEDAQAWVSRSRREGTEQREKQWRREP